ncbi:FG-GAP repeat domain-containing protein [Bacteroidota bacterium]
MRSQNFIFEQHPIDLSFQGIHAIKIIDLDGDGDLDIVGGSEITPTTSSIGIHWLRNDGGYPVVWTRFAVDVSFEHVMSVDVDYIDNDNYPDIVASSWSLHQIAWWKNSGDPTQSWTKNIVRSNFTNAHDAKCADIDDDGDVDIITANYYSPGNIILCYNDGSSTVNWQTSYLTNSFAGALRVSVIDLDKDDDLDILGTASDADEISWWSNEGGNPLTFSKNVIATNYHGSSNLYVIDMNYDEVYDVISNAWKSNQVAYWICNDIQSNSWSKYTVSNTLETAAGVSGGDMDEDGDIDIVAVGKIPGELVIYENTNFNWTKTVLAANFYGGSALAVIDFDYDNDLDIIAGASGLGELYLWENLVITSVSGNQNKKIPEQFHLFQNYPNPFNPTTNIKFTIPTLPTGQAGSPLNPSPYQGEGQRERFITLIVYDVLGSEIATLVNEEKPAGEYEVEFSTGLTRLPDGQVHQTLPSGIYFYRLQAGSFIETKKMILLK